MEINFKTKFEKGQSAFFVYPKNIGKVNIIGFYFESADTFLVVVQEENRCGNAWHVDESKLYATWQEAFEVFIANKRKEYEEEYDEKHS